MENVEHYKLDSTSDLSLFMKKKPAVVLEHLKSSQALPLMSNNGTEIRGRLLESMTQQLTKLY